MTTLPDGWFTATLGDFMVERGGSVSPSKFPDEEFELYSIPAHDRGGFELILGAGIGSSKRVVAPDDVMVSRIVPHIQRARIVGPLGVHRQIASTEWITFRSDVHDPRFLRDFLLSPDFHRQFMGAVSGVGGSLNRAQPARVKPIHVPVPPLDEQRRIVELLEGLLSLLDTASDSIRVSLRRLDVLRRLVVKELAVGESVPLKHLAVDSGYGTSVKCDVGGAGPAVVRIPNLQGGRIDLVDEKRAIDPTIDLSSSMLEPGDVLIIRTNGSKELIGRSGVVQEGVDAAFASYLIRYKVDTSRLRSEWLHTMLGSPALRAEIERLAASSAGQHNLSLGKLNGLLIPTPTLGEQDAGLARLAELDDQLGALRQVLDASLRRGESLRRSLLAAAFSGRLRPAESDNEGA